jgi:hypothetical protein
MIPQLLELGIAPISWVSELGLASCELLWM